MFTKENKVFFITLTLLTTAEFVFLFFNLYISIGGLSASFLIVSAYFYVTKKRKNKIKELISYMKNVAEGGTAFDLRDYEEGELSLLKSELYKITTILTLQSEHLDEEKKLLASALSDISHQLRTPLSSVLIMEELLQNPDLPPEKRIEFSRQLTIQLERMQWLILALLKLSRLDADVVEFKKDFFYLNELVKAASLPLLINMELKEQNFINRIDAGIRVSGDFNWLTEALTNILKNSSEHTAAGGEIIVTSEENPIYNAVIICDNGSGIPKSELSKIFGRFYKGKNSDKNGSVGIGLALSKSIIQKHGGDIIAESEGENKGTTFTVKFYS